MQTFLYFRPNTCRDPQNPPMTRILCSVDSSWIAMEQLLSIKWLIHTYLPDLPPPSFNQSETSRTSDDNFTYLLRAHPSAVHQKESVVLFHRRRHGVHMALDERTQFLALVAVRFTLCINICAISHFPELRSYYLWKRAHYKYYYNLHIRVLQFQPPSVDM